MLVMCLLAMLEWLLLLLQLTQKYMIKLTHAIILDNNLLCWFLPVICAVAVTGGPAYGKVTIILGANPGIFPSASSQELLKS